MPSPGKSLDSLARLSEAAEAQVRKRAEERSPEIAQAIAQRAQQTMDVSKEMQARVAARESADRVIEIDTSGAQAVARRFKEQDAARLEQAELVLRTAVAVEKSAHAAVDSKQGADAALMWARVAALISLAALVVAAWPYILTWLN